LRLFALPAIRWTPDLADTRCLKSKKALDNICASGSSVAEQNRTQDTHELPGPELWQEAGESSRAGRAEAIQGRLSGSTFGELFIVRRICETKEPIGRARGVRKVGRRDGWTNPGVAKQSG